MYMYVCDGQSLDPLSFLFPFVLLLMITIDWNFLLLDSFAVNAIPTRLVSCYSMHTI